MRRGKRQLSSACKECYREARKGRGYNPNNREHLQEYQRQYRARNKKRIRAYVRARSRQIKLEVITAYGGKCACCGEAQLEFLTIDHVLNDGADHRRKLKAQGYGSGSGFYAWLKKKGLPQDGRFQVLCMNCNWAKAIYGECPHVGDRPLFNVAGLPSARRPRRNRPPAQPDRRIELGPRLF
jgi:hypothetical protein